MCLYAIDIEDEVLASGVSNILGEIMMEEDVLDLHRHLKRLR